jgi:hypothetical protein
VNFPAAYLLRHCLSLLSTHFTVYFAYSFIFGGGGGGGRGSYFTTDGWSVSLGVEHTLGLTTRYYFLSECFCLKFAVLYLWCALSDERTGLQYTV